MLYRLAEAQVDALRQRRHDLGESNALDVGHSHHGDRTLRLGTPTWTGLAAAGGSRVSSFEREHERPVSFPSARGKVSRYDIWYVEIYRSARRHKIADDDIRHAVEHALAAGEQDDGQVLYLGPDRAANLLEVISVVRDDGSEIVIHAMRMRAKYEPFLRGEGDSDA